MADTPQGHVFVDAEKAGDPYWVECVGGPYDGEMVQMSRGSLRNKEGKVIVSRGFWVPESKGHYIEKGWANEELRVVRYVWHHDEAEEVEEAEQDAKDRTEE
jgi:hypothetical protein